jgi:hypothetical protein
MKASTISTIKKELLALPHGDLVELCMKLAKYKKENKELLTYLLFDANTELEYISSVKQEIDLQFSEINFSHLYFAKKSVRKILRMTQKYIRYSGRKQTEIELLIHFCTKLKKSRIPFRSSNSLSNLYANQVRKIHLAIDSLHEDLQHDYQQELQDMNLV